MSLLQPQCISSVSQGEDFLKSISRVAIRLHFHPISELGANPSEHFLSSPLSSRVLGPGYWEAERAWPRTGDGVLGAPMPLFLQINWAEVVAAISPADRAATLLPLPDSGITQIYLDPLGDIAGASTARDGAGWRIVHWDAPLADLCIRHTDSPGIIHPLFPVSEGATISFSAIHQSSNLTDAIEGLHEGEFAADVFDEMLSRMPDPSSLSISQIGGFPFLFQEDPRKNRIPHGELHRLFLQMGSDSPFRWKEDGQAHFFMSAHDLQRKDFSRTAFSCESA